MVLKCCPACLSTSGRCDVPYGGREHVVGELCSGPSRSAAGPEFKYIHVFNNVC